MTSNVNHHVAKSSAFTRFIPSSQKRAKPKLSDDNGAVQGRVAVQGSPTGHPSFFISASSLERRLAEIEAIASFQTSVRSAVNGE
jgi:hypothetical protein